MKPKKACSKENMILHIKYFMIRIILIVLISSFLGGCIFGKTQDNIKIYSYGTDEFRQKVETANISIDEAAKIMCKYKKENSILGDYTLYHIDGDNYVFKYGGFGKGLEYWTVRGTDGIYVNMKNATLKLINKNDKEYQNRYISLKEFNFLFVICERSSKLIEYKDKSNTFLNSIKYNN